MTATPYLPGNRPLRETPDELRARIPGWGVDLDPADRPSVPREIAPARDGDVQTSPDAQQEDWPRERSIEHAQLTPVFGTSCPPRGVSGALRRLAYAKYSEARSAHWLLLLAADRVDSKEHVVRSFLSRRPDNPITQTGVLSEARRHGLTARLGHQRVDVVHHPLDPVIVGLPWVLGAGVAYRIGRRVWTWSRDAD